MLFEWIFGKIITKIFVILWWIPAAVLLAALIAFIIVSIIKEMRK